VFQIVEEKISTPSSKSKKKGLYASVLKCLSRL